MAQEVHILSAGDMAAVGVLRQGQHGPGAVWRALPRQGQRQARDGAPPASHLLPPVTCGRTLTAAPMQQRPMGSTVAQCAAERCNCMPILVLQGLAAGVVAKLQTALEQAWYR